MKDMVMNIFKSKTKINEEWQQLLDESRNYMADCQNKLQKDFSLGSHQRFDWDQEDGSLLFSNDGIPAVRAKIQFVGSISSKSNTWLWSWANSTVSNNVTNRMPYIKAYGEKQKFRALMIDKWEGDEIDGWDMTSITAQLLNAKGAYRTSNNDGSGYTYMVITDIKWVN